jgi:hypothetical protein
MFLTAGSIFVDVRLTANKLATSVQSGQFSKYGWNYL